MESGLTKGASTEVEIKDRGKNKESSKFEVVHQIEDAVGMGDYRLAFRLFRKKIISILYDEKILDVCNPYYFNGKRLKEDKVVGEFVGGYEYYLSSNGGYRKFQPHGDTFRCGKDKATFLGAVREYLKLLSEKPGQDPWEILNDYRGSSYYDLENYIEKAGVYGFVHNRRSREIISKVLAPYVKRHYGVMGAGEFIDWYQAMDRVYCTYGFPFSCTYAGWFYEGYDSLYRKVFDEGAWVLHDFWEQGTPSDWMRKQMDQYKDIQPTYGGLIGALLSPEYEALLFQIFPFRLTENTLRPGCNMDPYEWEWFTFDLARALHFSECCGRRGNLPDGMRDKALKAMENVLEKIWIFGNRA